MRFPRINPHYPPGFPQLSTGKTLCSRPFSPFSTRVEFSAENFSTDYGLLRSFFRPQLPRNMTFGKDSVQIPSYLTRCLISLHFSAALNVSFHRSKRVKTQASYYKSIACIFILFARVPAGQRRKAGGIVKSAALFTAADRRTRCPPHGKFSIKPPPFCTNIPQTHWHNSFKYDRIDA